MKKTVVVVNPRSQGGTLGRRWPAIERVLRAELTTFEAVHTERAGDGARLCRAALENGAEQVVAFGGDGTLHEVANGFFHGGNGEKPVRPGAQLGFLPFGTGGDFRKTANLPKDVAAAARILRAGATRQIDLGHLTYVDHAGQPASCVFINIASFGIGGLVDNLVNRGSKALGGKVSFFLAATRAGMRYKNQRVRLTFDGKDSDSVEATINNVAVANGQFFGGGMHVAPHAALDDGQLDVVTIGDLGFFEMITNSRRIYKGTHLELGKVSERRVTRLDAVPVVAGDKVLLDVDGEALGALPASFTVLPKALTIVAPANG